MAERKRVRRRRSHNRQKESPASRLPHFFKIVLQASIDAKKLSMPGKFVRKFGDKLSDVAELGLPNGHPWRVRLVKDNEKIWFENGWHEFVEHHLICQGYILLFKYKGKSNFNVLIFDLSYCETEKYQTMNKNPMIKEVDITPLSNAPNSTKDENKSRSIFYKNEEMEIINNDKFPSKLAKVSPKHNYAIQAAKMFKPQNPSFSVVMQSHNFKSRTVYVPAEFARNHLRGFPNSVKLQVSEREWLVRTCWRAASYGLNLVKGWSDFSEDNNLQEGDVCVFEPIQLKNAALKVSIFRASNKHCKNTASMEIPKFEDLNKSRRKQFKMGKKVKIRLLDVANVLEKNKLMKNGMPSNTKFDEHKLSAEKQKGIKIIGCKKFPQEFAKASQETERAFQDKSNNPSFVVFLQSYNVYVPWKFAKYLRDSKHVKLQDPGGKEWPVELRGRNCGGFDMGNGWMRFCKDNGLKEGNVCRFELINANDSVSVLKVSIFHESSK